MRKKVFVETSNQTTKAYFGWQDKSKALWGLKEGYKNSADELVNIALLKGAEGDILTLDTYIFPVLFLFRHSIELSLKMIYHRIYGQIIQGHELDKLWSKVYQSLIQDFNIDKRPVVGIDFQELKEIFDELQNVDRKSDVWRYLIDNNETLFFSDDKHIDYVNLRDVLGDVYEKLDYLYNFVLERLIGEE